MDAQLSTPRRTAQLADRLAAARRARFVGRLAELELVHAALLEQEPPFAVLHLYGPGGVGKTALLGEYARIAAEAGAPAVLLDGRNVDPSPPGFLFALRLALGLGEDASPLEALTRLPRSVLLLDTYEGLAPLNGWMRDVFLPQLPSQTLVVIAGRNSPATAWHTDPGWQQLVRIVPLRNLRPEESRAYLSARGVPDTRHPAAISFTHGHPLALALVADVLARQGDLAAFSPEHEPDVVRVLLERFVEQVPSALHRQALEVCAHARVTTEALLAEALGTEEAHSIFGWLRGLSFVEHGPEGLFPHDLVREVLDADLRWRNPEGYRELHRRVRGPIVRRLQEARGLEQQRAFFDLLYLHRNSPIMRPFYDWKALGSAYAEPATPRDLPTILAMVGRHEGDTSARIAEYWWERQPGAFTAFRGGGGELIGFAATLALHQATPEDLEADPAAAAAWRFARRYGPAREGEAMLLHRFYMGRDTYQDSSPARDLVAMTSATHWLTTPRLAWSFLAIADPSDWHATLTYLSQRRSPEADFAVGGRHYAVYTHDWRAEPALVWLEQMGEREIATDLRVEQLETRPPAPLVVLSQPEFEEAVRRALRDYTRPDALAASPLLRSRLAIERAEDGPTPATLQALLREAAETLRANPKDDRLYRAVRATYLAPVGTQELAAERLGLPFSTFRYHLAAGVERITEWLWRRELSGAEG